MMGQLPMLCYDCDDLVPAVSVVCGILCDGDRAFLFTWRSSPVQSLEHITTLTQVCLLVLIFEAPQLPFLEIRACLQPVVCLFVACPIYLQTCCRNGKFNQSHVFVLDAAASVSGCVH